MIRLSELYSKIIKRPIPSDCGIACELVDPYMAKLNRQLTESVSCFSYTLVLSGTLTVSYDGKFASLAKNDLFIYTPGMLIRTISVSDDYSAICLMGDEATTYEIPYARNVIRATYFPAVVQSENKISLNDLEARWIEERMKEIILYINSDHYYKKECLYSLYSLFILDLLNVEKRFRHDSESNGHALDLYLKFMKLLTNNFISHHDISFYADALSMTTIYLSRIVKRFSGQTVKNHIDRLLVIEASYLLADTDKPISTISDILNFANPASFSKFFTKHRGVSPREYRNSAPHNL